MFALCEHRPLLAATQPLELRARSLVEAIAEPVRPLFRVGSSLRVGEEALRGDRTHLLPRDATDHAVRGDDADGLRPAVLGGEALEQGVGVLGEADLERADPLVRARTVEDEDPARPARADEARQVVDQLCRLLVATGV